ncbi:MAG: RagB/SusD family nutrient uptake outer membrane protein [Prevotella sp.]|nr:RagB/SusD family nutrient uptake outer membrane protein [Prevotella sp.]MBQ8488057.1 RagB/SusD family nutrient uptake outer membrane protein [Prevotella sp.]
MKKKSLLFAAFAAVALQAGVTSCSSDDDDSNSSNNNQIDLTNVVSDDASALSLVNGVYSHWQPLSSSFSFIIELNSNKLISFEGEESEAGPVNSRFEQQPDTWYQVKIFNHLLLGVAQDNEAITTVTNSLQAGKVTQAGYNAAVGKAKFLRGLAYLKLAQLWGEVPVFTEEGGSTTQRQELDVVFGQVVSDLTDAESLLLDYNGDPRTPSKQAAQALLARTYLVWGDNPLSAAEVAAIANTQTDPAFTKTDARLEKAVEYANKVISSGRLALDADYSKLYGRDYESNKRGTNEHLFTIAHDGDKSDAQGNHQTHCSWTFPFQNGENGSGYSQNHTEVADDDLYDDWKAEQPADKRLAETYLTEIRNPEDGLTYHYYSPVYTPINGKGVDQSYDDAENLEITQNSVDRIEIRYAEVLLTKAEALVQLGRNTEAAEPFNQLRRRAGIEEVSAPTFDQIKREWDYEFTYEQFSVLNSYRWKNLISSVKQVSGYKHFGDNWKSLATYTSDQEAYFQKVHNHLVAKYNNVRGKHYRQPIPTGLSGEDLGIVPQNPGY